VQRTIYGEEHLMFQSLVDRFLEREVAPHYHTWEAQGMPSRDMWTSAGRLGILGVQVPPEFGGSGVSSFKFNALLGERMQSRCLPVSGLRVHMDMALPYLLRHGARSMQERWLPGTVDGSTVLAIAMTEPGAGSDLAGIRTTAKLEGDEYVVDGSKTMISNGSAADLIITVVRTGEGRNDLSLLLIPGDSEGLKRGRNLRKIGAHVADTTELFFAGVRVPRDNMVGEPNAGLQYLTENLAQERLSIAVSAVAAAAGAIGHTIAYVKERSVFGRPLSSMQNTRFELATCAAEVDAAQAMVDQAIEALDAGALSGSDAARLKLFCTEVQGRVVDRCLQLHGGYGYLEEYPIARYYVDARATRLYGGSSEVMRLIIAKSMGL
jgi:alkylation response protein AidB-like acyl-CoA dehydrogenase